MRVLFTGRSLICSGGVEMYIYDVCRELLRRGHVPCVYAPRVGPISGMFRQATLPVVSRLADLVEPPDLIQGNFGMATFAAACRFPATPVVNVCHAWQWRGDAPPPTPNTVRHLAVDVTCRERLLCQHGLTADQVQVAPNGVDLNRFAPRGPLPERPARALIFSNYMTEEDVTPYRQACDEAGVALDAVGRLLGDDHPRPETLLPGYDLVFAKARCAREALATGCAVVVADQLGLGPMVTSARFEQQQAENFGTRLMIDPPTVARVRQLLAEYDAADAAAVAARVRAEHSLEKTVDQLLNVYEDAIDKAATIGLAPFGQNDAMAAFAEKICQEWTFDAVPQGKPAGDQPATPQAARIPALA